MILNTYSVLSLFIAALTGGLALVVGAASLRIALAWARPVSGERRAALESRSHLLLLAAVVVLWVKIASWPLFYLTLQSFVPFLQGAMCIFGVSRARPTLGAAAQILKPVAFLLIGAWLLLNRLDRYADTAPLFRRKLLLLSLVGLVVAADGATDLAYLVTFRRDAEVACCTGFFDLPGRATARLSASLLGPGYEAWILPCYYASNAALLACMILAWRRVRAGRGRAAVPLAALVSAGNAVVTTVALFEGIAPRVMHLPYHRCLYCMWQYAPHSIGFTALFLLGTMAPLWAWILFVAGRHKETMGAWTRYLAALYGGGAAALGLSAVWVWASISL